MAKKKGPPWWATTLMSAASSFGLGYLTAISYGMKPGEAAAVAGASALAPLAGVPVAAHLNPDGGSAEHRFDKDSGRSVENLLK